MKIEEWYRVDAMREANVSWTRIELYHDGVSSSKLGEYVTIVLDRKQSHDFKIGDEVRLTLEKTP